MQTPKLLLILLLIINKTNRGWHTQEEDKRAGTYAIGAFSEQRALYNTVAQEVTQLRIQIMGYLPCILQLWEKKR